MPFNSTKLKNNILATRGFGEDVTIELVIGVPPGGSIPRGVDLPKKLWSVINTADPVKDWFDILKQLDEDLFLSVDDEEYAQLVEMLGFSNENDEYKIKVLHEITAKSYPKFKVESKERTAALVDWLADNFADGTSRAVVNKLTTETQRYQKKKGEKTTVRGNMTEFFSLTHFPIARLDIEIQTNARFAQKLESMPALKWILREDLAEALYITPEADRTEDDDEDEKAVKSLIEMFTARSTEFKAQELIAFAQAIGCDQKAKCTTRAGAAASINETCAGGKKCFKNVRKALRGIDRNQLLYFENMLSKPFNKVRGVNNIVKKLVEMAEAE
jgi:hypothetical protein